MCSATWAFVSKPEGIGSFEVSTILHGIAPFSQDAVNCNDAISITGK